MKTLNLLAFDFGASSGRAVLGKYKDRKLEIQIIHRFVNEPIEVSGHLYWNISRFLEEIKHGLIKYVDMTNEPLDGIGIDTWGSDYGLLDAKGKLLGNPYHYRDNRTDGMFEQAFSIMPREEIFKRTGIAFHPFNTIYQLLSAKINEPELLEQAETMLLMPDLIAYFLTGQKSSEYTVASTGQLVDADTRDWNKEILEIMGFPKKIFAHLQQPGAIKGNLSSTLCQEVDIPPVPVIAVAGHDTASAIVAVPATEDKFVYLSSGTWSLLGVEVSKPVINEKTLKWNFTNEGGIEGTYRLLRNVMGLWVVQECKRQWDSEGYVSEFGQLVELAKQSEPFYCFIDPDDEVFYSPGDMPTRVQRFCENTGQKVPRHKRQILRCVFESLALKYRWVIDRLEEIVGRKRIGKLYIVGGGTKNELLNQLTADSLGQKVVAGPSEATAVGNLLVQIGTLQHNMSLTEMRQVVANSFDCKVYEPRNSSAWDVAYQRFLKLLQ
ncbi:MAG: carbohydrate kinase [Desulfobacterales bacterium PC51MH44]|jgi:rhamnulokinase|nr:MAG: carbohydrate kinase [Desulfobacterales bacterium PC51MH44]